MSGDVEFLDTITVGIPSIMIVTEGFKT